MITSIIAILGGILGGLMRFVPELLKIWNSRQDNEHELKMSRFQLQIDRARAKQKIDLAHVKGEMDQLAGQMKAYIEAIKGQSQLTGIPWVDTINMTVRPFLTYWWMLLFTIHKVITIIIAAKSTGIIVSATVESLTTFTDAIWSANDWGILSMILGFWFVDRAIRKNTGR